MVLSRVPRRFAWGVHAALAAMTAIYVAMSLSTSGLVAVGAWLATAAVAALWAAWGHVTRTPRGVVAAGATAVSGSRLLAGLLAAAIAAVLAAAASWGYLLATDPGSLPNPGFVVVMVAGAVGALPTLVRGLTGGLRLWRLDVGPDGVRYRGGRTDRTLPWIALGSVELNEPRTRLLLTPAENGGPPVAVPTLAFDVPPDALRDLVVGAGAHHRA